jgi:hypothetical protein
MRIRRTVSLRVSMWAKIWDQYHPGHDFAPGPKRRLQRIIVSGKAPIQWLAKSPSPSSLSNSFSARTLLNLGIYSTVHGNRLGLFHKSAAWVHQNQDRGYPLTQVAVDTSHAPKLDGCPIQHALADKSHQASPNPIHTFLNSRNGVRAQTYHRLQLVFTVGAYTSFLGGCTGNLSSQESVLAMLSIAIAISDSANRHEHCCVGSSGFCQGFMGLAWIRIKPGKLGCQGIVPEARGKKYLQYCNRKSMFRRSTNPYCKELDWDLRMCAWLVDFEVGGRVIPIRSTWTRQLSDRA